jgi:integrase
MQLPTIQKLKSYPQKVVRCAHLLDYFADKPVNRVEADDIEHYREVRRKAGMAHGTIDNEVATLSAMYHLAVRRKKISADFIPGEFPKNKQTIPRRIVTDEEVEKLIDHADQLLREVIITGYKTAMRLSEICNLTAGQVHLDIHHISGMKLDYIDLGIFDTKNGTRRTVPVCDELKSLLEKSIANLNPDDYVFTNDGKKIYPKLIEGRFIKTCKEAKIPYGDKLFNRKGERIGIVFHCLRHTRTTKWVEAGFSDEIIRRATGHKSLEAYRNYVKVGPQAVMMLVAAKDVETDNNGTKSLQSH